jgi:ABC-type dipeptide/oligopeptide/nickel transport system ATPase component
MNPLICTRCGARVTPAVPLVCAACGHEQEFVRQPLYCLVGPSGTGKSTVGHALLPRLADRFVVLEQDAL